MKKRIDTNFNQRLYNAANNAIIASDRYQISTDRLSCELFKEILADHGAIFSWNVDRSTEYYIDFLNSEDENYFILKWA